MDMKDVVKVPAVNVATNMSQVSWQQIHHIYYCGMLRHRKNLNILVRGQVKDIKDVKCSQDDILVSTFY